MCTHLAHFSTAEILFQIKETHILAIFFFFYNFLGKIFYGLYGRVNHEDMCECFVQCCQSVFMAQRWWTFQISLWCWLDFMVRCSLSFEKWWAAKFGLAFVIFSVSFMLQRTHKPANHTDKWSANYLNMSHNDVIKLLSYILRPKFIVLYANLATMFGSVPTLVV